MKKMFKNFILCKKAITKYENCEYDQALKLLEEAKLKRNSQVVVGIQCMRGLVHLHMNQVPFAEQYFLQLFKIDMDTINTSYFVYDFYKQKLKNTVLLVNSTTNNSISFSKSYLMPLIKACARDFEPGKKYLIESLSKIISKNPVDNDDDDVNGSNQSSNDEDLITVDEWFQVLFWIVFYLYEAEFYTEIVDLYGELASSSKYTRLVGDLDADRKRRLNLNEIYFYVGFSFFKLKSYSRANDVFDNYSFSSNNFNLIALYKILMSKITLLGGLDIGVRSRGGETSDGHDNKIAVQDEIELKNMLNELTRFHDTYDYMMKNVSFFYYKNRNLVSLDELRFHLGELYFTLGKYEDAYEYLKDYETISGMDFKIAFDNETYMQLFYRALHRTRRFDDLFHFIELVKVPGDNENYFKASCHFYKPIPRTNHITSSREFFGNKALALECLEAVRNKEYVYYQESVYLKLKCLFYAIMKRYKEANFHEMNVLARQYAVLEADFMESDRNNVNLGPSNKQITRLAYYNLQIEFFVHGKSYDRISSKLYFYITLPNFFSDLF
jgi:tetratricopeptide (TPR) repeat protein